ncbi:hypothetical protein CANMA_000841 [Candida margitis]|uniref:uncharacterized protein n=1 Tax=Candida margitis TaxID=1775924 RepID=UPI0022262899|nr:uncharacterized protein CANMA_000841 [Candida margitis]KAI5970229.1 hypothetical protein CANMA_000841 [Candida margitis]
MKFVNSASLTTTLLTLAPLISIASAGQAPGSLKMDFKVKRDASNNDAPLLDSYERRLAKRAEEDEDQGARPVNLELINNKTVYLAELYIGSNEDWVEVQIDTGSSDLWVMSSDVTCEKSSDSKRKRDQPSKSENIYANKRDDESDIASYISAHPDSTEFPEPGDDGLDDSSSSSDDGSGSQTCTAMGSFNTANSDTFVQNDTLPFLAIYADNSNAIGFWGHDTVKVGNLSVKDVSFAIVNSTTNKAGVFGVGLPGLETTAESGSEYENFPLKLKSEGIINKALYSLYLNDVNTSTGSILFGAIDHAKYEGTLETLPVLASDNNSTKHADFKVEVTDVTLNFEDSSKNILNNTTGAILDSGATLSFLSSDQVDLVGQAIGGNYSEKESIYQVDCSYQDLDSTLDIKFGKNKTIKIPFHSLIVEDDGKCYLGLQTAPESGYILFGDNVLRNAYIVYDVEDLEVHIAQAYYADEEDIEVVVGKVNSGGGQNSTSVGGGNGSNSTSSNSSSSNPSSSSNGTSTQPSTKPSSGSTNGGLSVYNLSWVSVIAGLVISFSLL